MAELYTTYPDWCHAQAKSSETSDTDLLPLPLHTQLSIMHTNILSQGQVQYTVNQGIGRITFGHPAHNSLPSALLTSLAQTIEHAGTDPGSRVLVLASEGERTFCAGASFDELMAITTPEQGQVFFSGFASVINAMRRSPKVIIGRVQGKCIGGGVGLAAATDYCLATPAAQVKLSELAVGIGPFVVGPAVERKIGTPAFAELSLDAAQMRTAEWAQQKGLFVSLSQDIQALDAAVDAFAQTLASYNPDALTEMKRIFWQGTSHWDTLLPERAAISGRLVLSNFTRQAIGAFKTK